MSIIIIMCMYAHADIEKVNHNGPAVYSHIDMLGSFGSHIIHTIIIIFMIY